MAKRKTRQQKIIADLRRQVSLTETTKRAETEIATEDTASKFVLPKKANLDTQKHLAYTNPYLAKDLRKTAFLTAGIIVGQFSLFFLLKQQILILPGISY